MKGKKIYIAGPMARKKDFNFAEFFRVEKILQKRGYEVVNPARIAVTISKGLKKGLSEIKKETFMKAYLSELIGCNSIYMLSGWVDSRGAQLEHRIANELNFNVIYQAAE